jgi:hypothetical protein
VRLLSWFSCGAASAVATKLIPGAIPIYLAKLARELNVRLCRIDNERRFIDEIPIDQETTNPIVPSCDFLCHLATMDLTD